MVEVILEPSFVEPVLFFFNDTATTEIYTLSLHDALPIYHAEGHGCHQQPHGQRVAVQGARVRRGQALGHDVRSEEHTSELQSQSNLVCRLLLEKKKTMVGAVKIPVTAKMRLGWDDENITA